MPSRNLSIRGRGKVIAGIAAVVLLLASAASGANLTDVRVGVHKDYSRVVFQLDGECELTIRYPKRNFVASSRVRPSIPRDAASVFSEIGLAMTYKNA